MSEESKILDLKSVEAIRDWVKGNFVAKNELVTLGLVSQLYVTFDEDFVGQTYTITGGDKTYSGVVPESKEVIVLVNAPNTVYTVVCPNTKGVEYTCKVTVGSKSGRYTGKLEGFYAYLHIQAEIGAIVTATLDDKPYTAEIGEDGYCTLKVKDSGTYSVVAAIGESVSEAVEAVVGETVGETVEVVCGEIPLEMVGWSNGTDVQIARMIDAARAGKIDLQTDGGWKVGDERIISTNAFRGCRNNQTHSAQKNTIVISSFEDYENCGCKMQFDFKNVIQFDDYISSTALNDNTAYDYAKTKMFNTILPNLSNALPLWVSSRLIDFTVKVNNGSAKSHTLSNISGNKLALRSEIEILGKTYKSITDEDNQEGIQVEYYKTQSNRCKRRGTSQTKATWWLRSRSTSINGCCAVVSYADTSSERDSIESYQLNNAQGIAPFGCL